MQAIIANVRLRAVRRTIPGVLALVCIVSACALLLMRDAGGVGGDLPSPAAAQDALLAEVQQLRAAAEVGPLARDTALDALAQQVLAEVLRLQCVCIADALAAVHGNGSGNGTSESGAAEDVDRAQGVALGWSLDGPGAVRSAGGMSGHGGVVADARWARVGIATLVVPDDVVWLVPEEVDAVDAVNLAGYTLAVLVTQSDSVAVVGVGATGD